ncbi:MAG: hypothetical protein C0501_26350 [Isosphaera sp.]|nr:hypothetical protein [Isosphaera sp.]
MRPAALAAPLLFLAAVPARPADPPQLPRLAPRADVKSVLDELAAPPVFGADPTPVPLLPFAAAALDPYAPDGVTAADILKEQGKYQFRVTVLRAVKKLRETPAPGHPRGGTLPLRIDAAADGKVRRGLEDAQITAALAAVDLERVLDELTFTARDRADEPPRWRAHHDLVTAQVRARLVLLHEYNLALANVRTDNLPPLPAGATGWRLVPAEQVRSRLEVEKLAAAAADGFRAVAKDHRGTPWAALADRDLRAPLGLAWEPVAGK